MECQAPRRSGHLARDHRHGRARSTPMSVEMIGAPSPNHVDQRRSARQDRDVPAANGEPTARRDAYCPACKSVGSVAAPRTAVATACRKPAGSVIASKSRAYEWTLPPFGHIGKSRRLAPLSRCAAISGPRKPSPGPNGKRDVTYTRSTDCYASGGRVPGGQGARGRASTRSRLDGRSEVVLGCLSGRGRVAKPSTFLGGIEQAGDRRRHFRCVPGRTSSACSLVRDDTPGSHRPPSRRSPGRAPCTRAARAAYPPGPT